MNGAGGLSWSKPEQSLTVKIHLSTFRCALLVGEAYQ